MFLIMVVRRPELIIKFTRFGYVKYVRKVEV